MSGNRCSPSPPLGPPTTPSKPAFLYAENQVELTLCTNTPHWEVFRYMLVGYMRVSSAGTAFHSHFPNSAWAAMGPRPGFSGMRDFVL